MTGAECLGKEDKLSVREEVVEDNLGSENRDIKEICGGGRIKMERVGQSVLK